MEFSLNGDWKFKVDVDNVGEAENNNWWDSDWIKDNYNKLEDIKLPNCWNIIPKLDKFEGIVWFFKKFTDIPQELAEFNLNLKFNGVNYYSKVWLNEMFIGENEGGVLPFSFNIIPQIIYQDNENYLAIRVENFRKKDRIPCKTFDWYNWGGIYRDIKFLILDKYRIDWAGIKTKIQDDNSAKINVTYEIINNNEEIDEFENNRNNSNESSEIIWNLYYLGNQSTIQSLLTDKIIPEDEKSKKIEKREEESNEFIIPESMSIENASNSIDNAIDGEDILDSVLFSDDEKKNDGDILDDLIREPVTYDEIMDIMGDKAEKSIYKETAGVLIQSGQLNIEKIDLKGNFEIILNEPKLWNIKNPELYRLELLLQGSKEPYYLKFGVREVSTQGTSIFLNNKRIRFYGVSIHEELLPYGRTIPYEERLNDILSIKSMGFNAIRTAHYPHNEDILDICDTEGLMVLGEEIPVYWGLKFSDKVVFKKAANMLKTMIRRDYNHPSLIGLSVGNEIPISGNRSCKYFIKGLLEYARKLDDTRLITAVMEPISALTTNNFFKKFDNSYFSVNSYFGWYYASCYTLNFLLDALHYANRKKPLILTEFGAGAKFGNFGSEVNQKKIKEKHKAGIIRISGNRKYTEEYQASVLSHHIKVLNSKDYVAGWFIWIYRDFRSHMRTNKYQNGFNRKGIVDEKNQKKLIARWIPPNITRKLDGIHNYKVTAGLFQRGSYPLFKLVAFIFNIVQGKVADVADKYYSNKPDK